MKILFLNEELNPTTSSKVSLEIAKELVQNHEVVIVARKLRAKKEDLLKFKKLGIKCLISSSFFDLVKTIYIEKPNIISFHAFFSSFLAAKINRFPIIKTYYGTQLNAYLEKFVPNQKINSWDNLINYLSNKALIFIEGIQFRLSDEVIAISKYTQQEASKLFHFKIPFIYLGVRKTNRNLKFINSLEKSFTILSVSRFTPYKGFHHLISAVKNLENHFDFPINLIFAGYSGKEKYIKYLRKIKTKNTRILIGVSDNELAKLYASCDIYATCDRYLFFGLPPLESALHGKPTLAMDYCAAQEIIIEEKTGFLAKDFLDFQKKLLMIINNKSICLNLGKNANDFVQNFNWVNTAKYYVKIFNKYAK